MTDDEPSGGMSVEGPKSDPPDPLEIPTDREAPLHIHALLGKGAQEGLISDLLHSCPPGARHLS